MADVFDEVEVHGIVVFTDDADVEAVVVFDFGGVGVELGVVEVFAFVKQVAVEGEEFLIGAFVGGDDAEVGDLFAADGVALAREGVGVLDVDVVRALGVGAVLVGGYAGHDVGGGELLGGELLGGAAVATTQDKEGCGEAHRDLYARWGKKFRGVASAVQTEAFE